MPELTRDEWDAVRQALLAPFAAERVRKHPHSGFLYLEEEDIRMRLDTAAPGWGVDLAPVPDREGRAFICRITVGGVVRADVGEFSRVSTNADTGKGMTDYAKAAATDAFKRAAQRWWVGNFLDYLDRTRPITPAAIADACRRAGWVGPAPQHPVPATTAGTGEGSGARRELPELRSRRGQELESRRASELVCTADGCGTVLTQRQHDVSVQAFGVPLCPHCQRQRGKERAAGPGGTTGNDAAAAATAGKGEGRSPERVPPPERRRATPATRPN